MKTLKPLFQWDINQKLYALKGTYVDFISCNNIYRVQVDNNTCNIPDEFLQDTKNTIVYECLEDGTLLEHRLQIHSRPKPPDYIYTPTERLTFDNLVTRIEELSTEVQEKIDSITGFTETDPTVPSWAKQPTKPTYSYNELTDLPELPSGGGSVTDVQINGTSITESGIANIPIASATKSGVISVENYAHGLYVNNGGLRIYPAENSDIIKRTGGSANFRPIAPNNLDFAVKTALTDGKASWTDTEKASARSLFGISDNTVSGMTSIDATADESMNLTFENYSEVWTTIVEKFPQVMLNVKVEVSGIEDYTIFEPMAKQVIGSTVAYMFGNTSVAIDGQSTLTTMVICMANTTMTQNLEFSGSGNSTDVQINGESILNNGVANIPKASSSTLGVVATDTWNGTTIDATGHIGLFASQETHLSNRTSNTAITPKNLDLALKIALTDGKASWTDTEKAAARDLLGIPDSGTYYKHVDTITYTADAVARTFDINDIPADTNVRVKYRGLPQGKQLTIVTVNNGTNADYFIQTMTADAEGTIDITLTKTAESIKVFGGPGGSTVTVSIYAEVSSADGNSITDVQINGTSITQGGVANIPVATTNDYGVVRAGNSAFGINKNSSGVLYIANASDTEITTKNSAYKPITPSNLDYAVKSGLADSKTTWTDAEKTAARELLGIGGDGSSVSDIQVNGTSVLSNGVANIPVASTAQLGAVKAGTGVSVTGDGGLFIQSNWDSQLSDRANRTNQAVTLGFIDKSVTAVLTDGKAPALTENQKKAAQDWLGKNDLYEVLVTHTTTEAVAKMTFNVTDDGTLFEDHVKEIYAVVDSPATYTSNISLGGRFSWKQSTGYISTYGYLAGTNAIQSGTRKITHFIASVENGIRKSYVRSSSTTGTVAEVREFANQSPITGWKSITEFSLEATTGEIPAGITVTILGKIER